MLKAKDKSIVKKYTGNKNWAIIRLSSVPDCLKLALAKVYIQYYRQKNHDPLHPNAMTSFMDNTLKCYKAFFRSVWKTASKIL